MRRILTRVVETASEDNSSGAFIFGFAMIRPKLRLPSLLDWHREKLDLRFGEDGQLTAVRREGVVVATRYRIFDPNREHALTIARPIDAHFLRFEIRGPELESRQLPAGVHHAD